MTLIKQDLQGSFLIREEMHRQFEEQVGNKYKEKIEVDYAYQNKKDLPAGFICPERENDLGARGMRYGRQGMSLKIHHLR